jgi:hypothetical protein
LIATPYARCVATTELTLDEYGRALGHLVWLERRAFEVLGEAARDESDPATKLALAGQSAHHGLHATLLEALLPSTRDHDPVALVGPSEASDEAVTGPAAALDRLAEAHAALRGRLGPVADAAAIRRLAFVGVDHESDARGSRIVR